MGFATTDWIVILFLVVGALVGFQKGLSRVFMGLTGTVIAIIVAIIYRQEMARALDQRFSMQSSLAERVSQYIALPDQIVGYPLAEIPAAQLQVILDGLYLPAALKGALLTSIQTLSTDNISTSLHTVGDYIFYAVGGMLLGVIAFALIVLAVKIGILLAGLLLEKAALRGSPGVNRLGGALVGFTEHLLIATVFLGVISPFLTMEALTPVASAIDTSIIANLLLNLFNVLSPIAMSITG